MVTSNSFTRKSILLALVAVFIVTSGIIWLNRNAPPVGFQEYNGYGFKFHYPQDYQLYENPLIEDQVTYWTGSVEGAANEFSEDREVFGFFWAIMQVEPSEFINLIFNKAEESGLVLSRENDGKLTINSQEVSVDTFLLNEGGNELHGYIGAWLDEKNRVVACYIITFSKVSEEERLNRFTRYIRSYSTTDMVPPTRELESYWPTDEWRYALPEEVGMSSPKLNDLITYIKQHGPYVDSVLVVKNGYLVLDHYFPPYQRGEKHLIFSCTKSVVSSLIGIAIDEGYIEGVKTRLIDIYPNKTITNIDDWKKSITLEHLLTMTAGFDARDSYLYDWEGLSPMMDSPDPKQHILNLPMAEEPGTRFEYTNSVSHLLSIIITDSTNLTSLEYGKQKLFSPLGITDVEWPGDRKGHNWGFSQIYLTPHDMAKFGFLYLKGGVWDNERIIPAEWVQVSTRHHVDATLRDGYGYQWWVDDDGYYVAVGYQGQFIFVSEEHNLIAVLTGNNQDNFDFAIELFESHILPALLD